MMRSELDKRDVAHVTLPDESFGVAWNSPGRDSFRPIEGHPSTSVRVA
jgi:hypothetical protein